MWFSSAMCRLLCLCAACVLCISSQSQQYETGGESSGGNIFMGSMFNQESLAPGQVRSDSTGDKCSFTFLVPQAQIQGAGCLAGEGKDPKMSMTKMHEDIIEVESRMIARDANTRREMREILRQLNLQQTRKELGGQDPVSSRSVDELATTVASMDSQILKLETMVSRLIDQVTQLEEKVISADSVTHQIGQYVKQGKVMLIVVILHTFLLNQNAITAHWPTSVLRERNCQSSDFGLQILSAESLTINYETA